MAAFVHPIPGTEVRFIAGHYTIMEEGRITHRGRDVLFIVGIAIVGSACCGVGGCRFVNVPGYVVSWRGKVTPDGSAQSEVDPVPEGPDRSEIRALLDLRFPHSQIQFGA